MDDQNIALDMLGFHNNSNETDGDFCNVSSSNLGIAETFICIFGLIFNGVALFVIIRLKDYRKIISHLYVLHLAIADFILLLYLPFQARQHFVGKWDFPKWFCGVNQGFFMMSYNAGIFFLTVMSFDRYVAICHPFSPAWRRIRTHKNAIIITIIVWIISLLFSLPLWSWSSVSCSCGYGYEPRKIRGTYENLTNYNDAYSLIYNGGFENDAYESLLIQPNHKDSDGLSILAACRHKDNSQFLVWIPINFVFTFAIPFIVMSVCYSLILWRVLHPAISAEKYSLRRRRTVSDSGCRKDSLGKTSFRSTSSSTSSSNSHRLNRKQKVTFVVVSLVTCFLLCWSPFHIIQLAKIRGLPASYTQEFCNLLNDFSYLLAYSNSMLNPIFYTFLGSDFRRRFRSATQIYRRRRRSSGFSKGIRTARTSAPSYGRSFGSAKQNKNIEGPTSYPMQSIHSMVSKHYSQDYNDRSHSIPSRNKEYFSKTDHESVQMSDMSEARMIR